MILTVWEQWVRQCLVRPARVSFSTSGCQYLALWRAYSECLNPHLMVWTTSCLIWFILLLLNYTFWVSIFLVLKQFVFCEVNPSSILCFSPFLLFWINYSFDYAWILLIFCNDLNFNFQILFWCLVLSTYYGGLTLKLNCFVLVFPQLVNPMYFHQECKVMFLN